MTSWCNRPPKGGSVHIWSLVSPGSPFRYSGYDLHNHSPWDFLSRFFFFTPEPSKLWSTVTSCGRGFTTHIFLFMNFKKSFFVFHNIGGTPEPSKFWAVVSCGRRLITSSSIHQFTHLLLHLLVSQLLGSIFSHLEFGRAGVV